ncbi:TetR/AcrR family transcriptional regulator [Cohnella suwonensis]|uniref:TetR/AcrR family transcriptional regulator n=1 Tax=Cohnella suwonensis TaxID=696072 RepID=A0ABW0M2F6_9BACL
MAANEDLRVRRTHRLLREAFIDLLQETEFYKISVHALTKRAEISRVTFYLHYRDMEDFIEQYLNGLIQEIEDILLTMEHTPYEPEYELGTLVKLLEYIADNSRIYKTLLVSKSIPYFTARLMEFMQKLILSRTKEQQSFYFKNIPDYEMTKQIAAWYSISAMVGTISLWLGDDMPYSPRFLAQRIVKLNPFRPEKQDT